MSVEPARSLPISVEVNGERYEREVDARRLLATSSATSSS